MSRKVDESTTNRPATDLPSSATQTLWARHRRAFLILLIAAVAVALLTAAAIFLASSTHPAEREPSTFAEAVEDDLEGTKHQFIDVVIWIGWCIGVALIGLLARSELRNRPTGDQDADAVQDGEPIDPG